MNLRREVFRLNFKRGVEPIPAEITGPIVGMFQLTRYSYEIIWLEEKEEATDTKPKPKARERS